MVFATGNIEDVVITDKIAGINFYGFNQGDVINVKARGCTDDVRGQTLRFDHKLIDCDFEDWNIVWSGDSQNHKLIRQYTFNLKVQNGNGLGIQNANVTLNDKDNNIVFSVLTGGFTMLCSSNRRPLFLVIISRSFFISSTQYLSTNSCQ